MSRASRWCARPARSVLTITQMPINGMTSSARPSPMAAPLPEVMNAIAMRPSSTK